MTKLRQFNLKRWNGGILADSQTAITACVQLLATQRLIFSMEVNVDTDKKISFHQ